MNIYEAEEVTEASSPESANDLLNNGWTLLAAVPGGALEGGTHVKYVLGRKRPAPPPAPRPPHSPKIQASLDKARESLGKAREGGE